MTALTWQALRDKQQFMNGQLVGDEASGRRVGQLIAIEISSDETTVSLITANAVFRPNEQTGSDEWQLSEARPCTAYRFRADESNLQLHEGGWALATVPAVRLTFLPAGHTYLDLDTLLDYTHA